MNRLLPALFALSCLGFSSLSLAVQDNEVRLKDMAHIEGVRDNALVGYGIVIGLAGTGDTSRSGPTVQSIANALTRFGVRVTPDQIASRNIAAVVLTASLPAFASAGDKLDVTVSALGDARSITGGTLMLAPLHGPDDRIYALAQGPVSVGGFRYDAFGNLVQKNHPTAGMIPGGASVELTTTTHIVSQAGNVYVLLDSPDYTTASRVADTLNASLGPLETQGQRALAVDAQRIAVRLSDADRMDLVKVIRTIEGTVVVPDQAALVVVNERTGTVVSGGDVRVGQVTIAQGDLKVDVSTRYNVSQPLIIGQGGPGIRTVTVPEADLKVSEHNDSSVNMPEGTRVADLVAALNKIKVTPRDIISILQAIKRANALHAQLVIQ